MITREIFNPFRPQCTLTAKPFFHPFFCHPKKQLNPLHMSYGLITSENQNVRKKNFEKKFFFSTTVYLIFYRKCEIYKINKKSPHSTEIHLVRGARRGNEF